MNAQEFFELAKTHGKWLNKKKGGKRLKLHKETVYGSLYDGLLLNDLRLEKSELTHCKFLNVSMRGSKFNDSDISSTEFAKSNLRDCDFSGCRAQYSDFRVSTLAGACFKNADVIGSNFSSATLVGAELEGANIDFATFQLACRHTKMKLDIQQIRQLLYTVYKQVCEDPEYGRIQDAILPYVSLWDGLERHRLTTRKVQND